jgi:hypothetical protein
MWDDETVLSNLRQKRELSLSTFGEWRGGGFHKLNGRRRLEQDYGWIIHRIKKEG